MADKLKKITIKKRIAKQTLLNTQAWRKANGVVVKSVTDDPKDKNFVTQIEATGPSDLILTQFKGKFN